MHLSCQEPWYLLGLLALPVVAFLARHSLSGLERGRLVTAVLLRSILLVILVLALAQLRLARDTDQLSVCFALDVSRSIPPDRQRAAQDYLATRAAELTDRDRASVLLFGADASFETVNARVLPAPPFASLVDAEGTDIGAAIRLALASFPEGSQRRIVLVTDGNENRGSAVDEARNALGQGAVVDVLPIDYRHDHEVALDSLIVPNHVKRDEPFDVRIAIHSLREGPARLRLYQDGELAANQEVQLAEGKNVFTVPRKVERGGTVRFEAMVEAAQDDLPDNNRASGFAIVEGKTRVLLLEGDPAAGRFLADALAAEGLDVDRRGRGDVPNNPAEFLAYETVILAGIPAESLGAEQMKILQSMVRDSGCGLLMIGGEGSFGAGNYAGTPVEEALPVGSDFKQRKIFPVGAVAFVVDYIHCIGNGFTKEVLKITLDNLSRFDHMGVLDSERGRLRWVLPLEPVGTNLRPKKRLIEAADIEDIAHFDPGVREAEKSLVASNASMKHMILITDGSAGGPTNAAIDRLVAQGITLSVILIEPSFGNDGHFRAVAQRGRGRFYVVQPSEGDRLPKISITEAKYVRRSILVEEAFAPVLHSVTDPLRGFGAAGWPSLSGYVVTEAKPLAEVPLLTHKGDPLLAHWRYGLGKSLAFTSDATNRWGTSWVAWDHYSKFWAQVVRWTMRDLPRSRYALSTALVGGKARVVLDAVTPGGEFINFLKGSGNVVDPGHHAQPLELVQTAPGRYEAEFPADQPGSYIVNLGYSDAAGKEGGFAMTGVCVPFGPELRDVEPNQAVLQRVADAGGGRLLDPGDPVFVHSPQRARLAQDLWPLLLALVIPLVVIDIAFRKIRIDPAEVRRGFRALAARLRMARAPAAAVVDPVLDALLKRKESVRAATTAAARVKFAPTAEALERAAHAPLPGVDPQPGTEPQAVATAVAEANGAAAAAANAADGYTARLLAAKQRAQNTSRRTKTE